MAGFPQDWLSELISRNDIASVIGQYVELRPKGGRLWGLCPFHGEKTPSFSVSADKQLYYCFGCHAGGNVIGFMMEIERLSYPETVKLLAQRVNLPLPEVADDESLQKERELRDRLYAANREAAMFYYNNMVSSGGKLAREYMAERGVDASTAKAFGIGYSPPKWDALIKHLLGEGFTREELVLAGLAVKKNDSEYDMFRGRLMFPIIGTYQRVIGFGARAMGDEQPKYLNTNETSIFNKRSNLYALNMQKGRIKSLTIVEGYMDVVGLYRHGIKDCVATLGTALTQQQARLLKRYANDVYIAYDGDSAGQNAAERAIDILASEGLNARAIIIPGGSDPDEYVGENGAQAFEKLRENALSLAAFKLHMMEMRCDINSEEGRADFARQASAYIATLSPLDQERYFTLLARKTGFSSAALRSEGQIMAVYGNSESIGRNSLNEIRNTRTKDIQGVSEQRLYCERVLIALAADGKEYAKRIELNSNLFGVQAHREFLRLLCENSPTAATALASMDEQDARFVAQALSAPLPQDKELTLEQAIKELSALNVSEKITALQAEADADETPMARKLECARNIKELRAGNQ